jgi:error-prone DNA polymerase
MGFYAPAQIVRDAREHGVAVLPADVNASGWDCGLEIPPPHRSGEELVALRLGLRQIDGLPEHAAARLIAAREHAGPFADVAALRERAGLSPAIIERLAAADAFTSLQLPRRQALWDARSLIAAPDLPLFAHAQARGEGAERTQTRLPQMQLSEEVVADYQTQRLSLKAHPLAFLRASLAERGFVRCADLKADKLRAVQVAGVVLIRQRPGSAKGVVFVTIEDETGVANIVVWPDMTARFRKEVMGARLLEVRGRVERDDEVIHVIAAHIRDASGDLALLSDGLAEGGHSRSGHSRGGHPRNARVIPKSRDFH